MRDHCWTQGGQLRFYCGAPLVAANNHRIGTLCARQPFLHVSCMDGKPFLAHAAFALAA